MVRVKHRYLLVNILYPEDDPDNGSAPGAAQIPDLINFRKPSPSYLNAGQMIGHIRSHVAALYGDYGAGVTGVGLSIKYFSQATSTFIVRCPRAHYRLVWSALTSMTNLPASDGKGRHTQKSTHASSPPTCVMRVVRVSGTIRKSEEEAIRRARADILKAQRQTAEAEAEEGNTGILESMFGRVPGLQDVAMVEDDDDSEEEDEQGEEDLGVVVKKHEIDSLVS